ncbi:MAG: acyltransferase domain-containing protein, partial [Actinomycetota bacterium]|nr:acyltransferase domain-containing protein [Actinomycetota bacterium]
PVADRVAGLSGFGFGGTNFHAVVTGHTAVAPRHGLDQWPAELFLFHGPEDLAWLRGLLDTDNAVRLRDLALSAARRFDRGSGQARIAIVARDVPELARQLAESSGDGVFLADEHSGRPTVAVLFPGQGSQRVGMVADLFVAFPELQELLRIGGRWADVIYPGAAFDDDARERQRDRLRDTRIAQPALGIADLAVYRLLTQVGVRADMLGGHSYGELVALAAAGALTPGELFDLSEARAEAILAAAGADAGAMAAVSAGVERVGPLLVDSVVIANHNSPTQVVISGPSAAVAETVTRLRGAGISANPIPVACAFHSPLVAEAGRALAVELAGRELRAPEVPVWSNRTATVYPTSSAEIRAELAAHIGAPVRFADQIEAMYADGARVFVESGPGRVLSGLVAATLGDRPHRTVHCEADGGGLPGALRAMAELAVSGVPLRLGRLFRGRDAVEATGVVKRPQWTVDGQAVHGADGRFLPGGPMPATRVAVSAVSAHVDPDELVADYLRTSRELVAAQRDVLLAYFGAGGAPRQAIVEPVRQTPVVEMPIVAVPQERADTLVVVTAIISERTGYPIDMIEPDLDLEADLSIDSIKRTELVGELANRFTALDGFGDTAIEELTQTRTAGGLARWLDDRLGVIPQIAAPSTVVAPGHTPLGVAPKRFVLATIAAPGSRSSDTEHLAGRQFAISGGSPALVDAVTTSLSGRGASVVGAAPADGLIHLDALTAVEDLLPEQYPIFRAAATLRWLIAVVPQDSRRTVGMRGFVRSIARECPHSTVRLVEVDPITPVEVLA